MTLPSVAARSLDKAHPKLQRWFALAVAEMAKTGVRLLVTSGARSLAQQAALYAQGRTAPGKIVTNAPPGESPHNPGVSGFFFAIDVVPVVGGKAQWNDDALWARVGGMVSSFQEGGLTWGGNFKNLSDKPHIEVTGWRTLRAAPQLV